MASKPLAIDRAAKHVKVCGILDYHASTINEEAGYAIG
jgi:hypothetical protein